MKSALALIVAAACGAAPDPIESDSDIDPHDTDIAGCTDVACGLGAICEADECVVGDRDNRFATATPIGLADAITANIQQAGDVDIFAYASGGGEWIRVETTPDEAPQGLDTVVSIFDPGQQLYAIGDAHALGDVVGYDSVVYAWLPAAGTWYVAVEDRSSNPVFGDGKPPRSGPSFVYTLRLRQFVNTTLEPDDLENPSATAALADASTAIAVGVVLDEPGDADWVAVDLPYAHAPLEVHGEALTPGSEAIARVEAYDPHGTLAMRKDGVSGDEVAWYFATTAETWHIGVSDVDGRGGEKYWLTLFLRTRSVEYFGDTWEIEPDDASGPVVTTTPMTTEQSGRPYRAGSLTGVLQMTGDTDHFFVDVAPGEYVTVRCASDEFGALGDPALEITTLDGTLLAAASDGADRAPDVANVDPQGATVVSVNLTGEGTEPLWGPAAYYRCFVYLTDFEVE